MSIIYPIPFESFFTQTTFTFSLPVSAINTWATLDVRSNCTVNESCPCNVRDEAKPRHQCDGD